MSGNWGGTGLMEIPTARVLPDGGMRLGVASASPYIWYAFGFGILPGLEFSSRYTDVTNMPSGLGSDYGSYKDKAFDLKYQLFPESKSTPAVAFGINDFQGNRLFEATYLVFSRQIYPLDFTLGVGSGRLKGPISIGDEIGFWGGIEWAVTERLHMMLEYNPIEYEKDPLPVRGVPEGASLPFNVGVRYRSWPGFDIGLSYQRGDVLGLSVHFQFGLGRPILPPKPDPPSWQFAGRSIPTEDDPAQRVQRLATAIEQAGFSEVRTEIMGSTMIAELENQRYFSDARAAGRVLRLMLVHAGNGIDQLIVVLKQRGLNILYVSVAKKDARDFFMGALPQSNFARSLTVTGQNPDHGRSNPTAEDISSAVAGDGVRRRFSYGIDLSLESFFNDPSGVYQAQLSLKPYATLKLWPGGVVHGSLDLPLYSDVETANLPPEDAVRSDYWKYLGSGAAIDRLLFDQMVKLAPFTYARISGGYLERMYAGVGGEVLTFLNQGRFALGLEGDWVQKRDPDDPWGFIDQQNHTLLSNVYYHYVPLDITLKAQVGRFLAGDTGVRLEFRRRFDTGAQVGFWYSMTDTSDLSGFNEGYNDKGLFLKLPFAVFTDRPTTRMLEYRISPWTRDVGATIDHWQEVHESTSDLTPVFFRSDLEKIDD